MSPLENLRTAILWILLILVTVSLVFTARRREGAYAYILVAFYVVLLVFVLYMTIADLVARQLAYSTGAYDGL